MFVDTMTKKFFKIHLSNEGWIQVTNATFWLDKFHNKNSFGVKKFNFFLGLLFKISSIRFISWSERFSKEVFFREILTNKSVCIFISFSFPWIVEFGKKEIHFQFRTDHFMFGKLFAVIGDDCRLSELRLSSHDTTDLSFPRVKAIFLFQSLLYHCPDFAPFFYS